MNARPMTAGASLKPQHFEAAAASRAPGGWFEVHAENYMVDGGPRLAWLDTIRANHPLSLHGVAMSLASEARPDAAHLQRWSELVRRLEPALLSEHLAWSSWQGQYLPDLLPFVRTSQALQVIARNVDIMQTALGRRVAIENPSHYLQLPGHEWDEIDFLAELARRTGCGLLMDVNNVQVSAHNLGFSATAYVDRFPGDAVMEIHLAGHSCDVLEDRSLLIDSHDTAVAPEVWALFGRLVERIGPRPALIERDAKLPEFELLMAERDQLVPWFAPQEVTA